MIGGDARWFIQISQHQSNGFRFLRRLHLFHHLLDLLLQGIERGALPVFFCVSLDFVEREIIDRFALLIDSVDRLLTELMRETKRDLHPLVGIAAQFLRNEFPVTLQREIGTIGDSFDRNFVRVKFCEARSNITQLGLLLRREDTVDFHVVQIETGIPKVVGAEHHHLNRSGRWL